MPSAENVPITGRRKLDGRIDEYLHHNMIDQLEVWPDMLYLNEKEFKCME
jgi:hypothetical protein